MINPSKKQFAVIYSVAAILAVFYILSLTVFSKTDNKRHLQQIQLLHEADIPNIDIITIQCGSDSIILSRTDNMWLLVNPKNPEDRIPADTQHLQKFFVLLASKHNMYRAGKSNSTNGNSYGLNESEGTYITLYKNGAVYQQLVFGSLNFSQTERYFTTQELKSVFLAGREFESFISVSQTNWTDPYIISSQLRNDVFIMGEVQTAAFYDYQNKKNGILSNSIPEQKAAIDKLLELRHGGFAEINQNIQQNMSTLLHTMTIILELGDKSKIILEFFEHPQLENEYIVQTSFDSERTGKSFTYTTQISLWTYNKISEMTL